MIAVGLTGGIASGKSTVGEMFERLGGRRIDSDQVVHELLEHDRGIRDAIAAEFGPRVVVPGGGVDRKALGAIVFADPDQREALNRIVHPAVRRRQDEFLRRMEREIPHGVAIVDAALMIETGSYTRYDRIVVVSCRPDQQRERLRARNPLLTGEEIDQRIRAQMPLAEKVKYADYVIDNSGGPDETRLQVEAVFRALMEAV